MLKPFDILVAGEINPDLILSGNIEPNFSQVEQLVDSATLTIGSSSAIFACGAARLGLKVAFIGKCGEDVFGRFMLEEMRKRNVDVGNVIISADAPTGMGVILNRGVDRWILTHLGLISALRADEIPDGLLRQARHLHVASYFLQQALQPGLPGLFQRAHHLSLTTSLDTNYDPSGQWKGFDALLDVTDVFLPNEAEACSLTGAETPEKAADRLGERLDTLAVKLGAKGALGISKGKKIRVPSIPIQVVDTVGAGDSFDAGFLFGWLNGWSLRETLALAVACGSLSTRSAGGTPAQPTLAEAMRYLSSSG